MSKFRQKSVGTKTENLAGGEAYKETSKLELVSLLLTSFVKDKFYQTEGEQLERLSSLVKGQADKKFVAKAAIYARTKFGMRSITHALTAELADIVKGQQWMKNAVEQVVFRPDDMLEILGYYLSRFAEKSIPNSLKKGLRLAIGKFNSYQLAKYRGGRSSVKLVDLFNIVHPKPNKENESLYKQIIEGKLKSTDTWETKLTQAGQAVQEIENDEEKKEKLEELKSSAWEELLTKNKLGYFALLRNLRNIIEQAPLLVDEACKQLVNETAIKKSLVLPFRFLTALKEIQILSKAGTKKVVQAIDEAVGISLNNVPRFEGKSLIVLDESGSMNGKPKEIGSLFSAVMYKANFDADFMAFADVAQYLSPNASDSVLTLAEKLGNVEVGGGTNFHSIFQVADKKYDRIIILSDMQGWIDYNAPTKVFNDYKKKFDADPFIYSFDLNGYGTLMFPERNVFCLAGFSDKTMELMKLLETDRNAMITEIEKIKL